MPKNKTSPSKTECTRCGTCCKKGGPALHLEDKWLIEEGHILSKQLYTIRKGEPSYDNIQNRLRPATSDIIKIKAYKNSRTCCFYNINKNECSIYAVRPLECRVLKCWDTRDIEEIYTLTRLTRQDLVSEIKGLSELIDDHQGRCAYHRLKHFADDLQGDQKDNALEKILEMIVYDASIRQLVAQKGRLDPEQTDFLFGRPLEHTIRMYGLKVEIIEGRYSLTPFKGYAY